MKNLNNFKKLSREELRAIKGGVDDTKSCIDNCNAAASAMCAGLGGGVGGGEQLCFYSYVEDCYASRCAGQQ